MSALLPAAVYGLEVPAGDILFPAAADFPSAFRITMAALDPTAPPEHPATLPADAPPRATLHLYRVPIDEDESDEEDDEDDEMDALVNGDDTDEDDSDDEAGPSDPAKSKKAKRNASLEALRAALAHQPNGDDDEDEDEEMGGLNGKIDKGKGLAVGDESDDDDEDGDPTGLDHYVVCTLDPTSHYQQPLDITVGERESVFFKVTGTHTIYLTGNYVMPVDDTPRGLSMDDEDELDYDDEDELEYDDDEESDELDDIDDPRITEVDSEEEAPKLITAKGNKKRVAEEETLDEIMAKAAGATNGLSKKQQKKLKNNAGEAADAPAAKDEKKSDKKVQFAKNLEQGPTGSTADKKGKKEEKKEAKKAEEPAAASGTRTVQGVKIDDRKTGKGPAAKKGSTVGMRYIGKLENGQVFDSNKKGKPFSFKLGAGNVIKGWEIGVEGMQVGTERRITVPPSLAYGKQNIPGIPKNSTLVFDLKLIELK